eukprot:TRINITY_DN608_c0_g1_i1.p1 TRINITY_DN608_c0_g1~~TRINITY_DN608_c0_g1_i1.p1  ORF type:complete len:842 (-),score=106.92 TRINITY_DN608_c0_g1_i1:201-2726(-)
MPKSTMKLLAVFLLGSLPSSLGDVYTYPVKSINLESAMKPAFYTAIDPSGTLSPIADFHPVHGIQTQDGGFVLVGKALHNETTTSKTAFAVKLDMAGVPLIAWTSGTPGDNAANAVVELPNGDLLVAGYRYDPMMQYAKTTRCLTKLTSDLVEVWTHLFDVPPSQYQGNGAWEMISLGIDSVILAGLISNPAPEMSFKSYGNVPGGHAIVERLPLSVVMGSSKPTDHTRYSDIRKIFNTSFTSKAARELADGRIAVLLYHEWQQATVMMLSSNGSMLWGPYNYHQHGEATDLQVSADGASLVLSGQGAPQNSGPVKIYSAKLTKIDAHTGMNIWTKEYTAGGTPTLIYNECWGVVPMKNGDYVLACGTGIENCGSHLSAQDLADCQQGLGDKRPGAIPRAAGVWQSLLIRTDPDGNLLWQRVDSYKDPAAPPLNASTPAHRTSSAAEWAFECKDGGLAVVMDEVGGVGLMKLAGFGDGSMQPTTPMPSMPGSCVPFNLQVDDGNGCEECTSWPCVWKPCSPIQRPICSSTDAPTPMPMTAPTPMPSMPMPPYPMPMTNPAPMPPMPMPMTNTAPMPPMPMPMTNTAPMPPMPMPMTNTAPMPPMPMPPMPMPMTAPMPMPMTAPMPMPPHSVQCTPQNKCKILCLHGIGGPGSMLEAQIASLVQEVEALAGDNLEFIYPMAPYSVYGGSNGYQWIRDIRDPPMGNDSWDKSVQLLDSIIMQQGPFYGILGFAEGSAFAGYYTAIKPPGTFQAAMLFNGYLPTEYPGIMQEYDAFSPVHTPALVFMGMNDQVIDNNRTSAQAARFPIATVIVSATAGHHPPGSNDDKFMEVAQLLASSVGTR